ncbi:hypothetical protein [Bacillus gaemokensis]|uniref:Uncharacterized protein n=1 Tax=Bacillus gaemokensis TaxID=574375 RepID=A0A073KIH0_9BACI|nr:hypothetical protein [Bacillus gaemokensis]KEK22133.1 hypothetical protein BAGA_20865 [Bacillus gaemokensis]KYG35570.1 hypothetical protein AZF08_26200 [Bacillus gaemokensis]
MGTIMTVLLVVFILGSIVSLLMKKIKSLIRFVVLSMIFSIYHINIDVLEILKSIGGPIFSP